MKWRKRRPIQCRSLCFSTFSTFSKCLEMCGVSWWGHRFFWSLMGARENDHWRSSCEFLLTVIYLISRSEYAIYRCQTCSKLLLHLADMCYDDVDYLGIGPAEWAYVELCFWASRTWATPWSFTLAECGATLLPLFCTISEEKTKTFEAGDVRGDMKAFGPNENR